MTNDPKARGYDLEERTALFGEASSSCAWSCHTHRSASPLISQFVRSATRIGANHGEADDAESKADFRHKIALCRKEARETRHWCHMLAKACPSQAKDLRVTWKETNELHLIFARIVRTTDANLRQERAAKKRPAA